MDKYKAIEKIIQLCEEFELFTRSPSTKVVKQKFKDQECDVNVILTFGEPSGIKHCSECKENLNAVEFTYYQARVADDGYLSRHNALCHRCKKVLEAERKQTLKKAEQRGEIPPKPKEGSRCPYCDRAWSGNWHRHHNPNTNQFVNWYCGNCNMALQDRRNRKKTKPGLEK